MSSFFAKKAAPAPVAAPPAKATKEELTARLNGAREEQLANPKSYINSPKYTLDMLKEMYKELGEANDLSTYAAAIEWFIAQVETVDDAKRAAKGAKAAPAAPAPKPAPGKKAIPAAPAPARAPLPSPALPPAKKFNFGKKAA